jgi:hypothetical protein
MSSICGGCHNFSLIFGLNPVGGVNGLLKDLIGEPEVRLVGQWLALHRS